MRWLVHSDDTLEDLSNDDPVARAIVEIGRETLASRKPVVEEISDGPAAIRILAEYLQPPLKMLVFGSGKDAAALLRITSEMNWPSTVVDPGAGNEGISRYPGSAEIIAEEPVTVFDDLEIDHRTAVVMMSHLYKRDRALLELLAPTDAPYIGLLGASSRRDSLISDLSPQTRESLGNRLHAPVGLDIGGESPAEIALSVAAEIVAVFSGREGGFLRERSKPIHD
jgi:xanthine/CO dehydrogenase XdhC/CoxF family maturation factor